VAYVSLQAARGSSGQTSSRAEVFDAMRQSIAGLDGGQLEGRPLLVEFWQFDFTSRRPISAAWTM